jgi:hypothetical protein
LAVSVSFTPWLRVCSIEISLEYLLGGISLSQLFDLELKLVCTKQNKGLSDDCLAKGFNV